MNKIIIYTKDNCPYCDWAKQLLTSKQLSFEEIRIDLEPEKRVEMEQRSGRRTVPQIFINDKHVGGFDDLSAIVTSGRLSEFLN